MTEVRTAIPEEVDRYLESLVRAGPFTSKAELVRAALLDYVGTTGPLARGFDRENGFAPDGRVYQVEYARESSKRGLPAVGVVYEGGVLLAAATHPHSRTMRPSSKIRPVGKSVAVVSSGLMADAHIVLRRLRKAEIRTQEELVDLLAETYWEHTVDRNRRPLAAALLVASVLGEEPELLYFDPSGAYVGYEAAAIGEGDDRRRAELEKAYKRGSSKEAEKLALEVLGRPPAHDLVHVSG